MQTTNYTSRVPPAPIETADTLRARAKHRMMDSGMHGLIAHEVVEAIISAAMLEMSGLMRDMLKEANRERAGTSAHAG